MAYKITVQDGIISYGASDPTLNVNFGIRGQLVVGNVPGDGTISAPTGHALTIQADTGITLQSITGKTFALSATGELLIGGSAGTTGQVLTSSGAGTAAIWGTATTAIPNRTPLVSGTWYPFPSMLRLLLIGTGSISVDAQDVTGTITSAVYTSSATSATDQIEFPYFGDTAYLVRVNITGSLTVQFL